MAKYGVGGVNAAVDTTATTIVIAYILTANLRRFKVYDFSFGTTGAPADNVMTYELHRSTAIGTGGGLLVPQKLDDADAAAQVLVRDDSTVFSAQPTNEAVPLFLLGVNQRASYRWVASPGGELVSAAVNNEGLNITTLSPAYVGVANATAHFEE